MGGKQGAEEEVGVGEDTVERFRLSDVVRARREEMCTGEVEIGVSGFRLGKQIG